MAEEQKFEVLVSGSKVSVQDWLRAGKVSRGELKEHGVTDRRDLARIFAEERIRSRGLELATRVESILSGLSDEYHLKGVVAEPGKERWLVKVQTREGIASVAVPSALVDDVVDSGALQDLDELRTHLERWLTRVDLIAPRSRNDAGR